MKVMLDSIYSGESIWNGLNVESLKHLRLFGFSSMLRSIAPRGHVK